VLSLHRARADDPKPAKPAKPDSAKPAAAPDKPKKPEKPAEAPDKPKKPQGAGVNGVVRSVDATQKMITLAVRDGGTKPTQDKTFPPAADATVLLADMLTKGEPVPKGSLADLSEGIQVHAVLAADGKAIETLTAFGPDISGHVKAIDPAKGTITITGKDPK